jgi:hypothetical protein
MGGESYYFNYNQSIMINNFSNKKIFASFLKKKKNPIGDRNIMHPEREWFFGIVGGLVVLIVGLFWSLSIYTHYNDISVTTSTSVNEVEVYKTELVNSALIDLFERQRIYNSIKAELIDSKSTVVVDGKEEVVAEVEVEISSDIELDTETEEEIIDEGTPLLSE